MSHLTYEQLLDSADQEGLAVKEQPLSTHDGLIRGTRIAIRKDIPTQAKKACVLAEELGHHYTSAEKPGCGLTINKLVYPVYYLPTNMVVGTCMRWQNISILQSNF